MTSGSTSTYPLVGQHKRKHTALQTGLVKTWLDNCAKRRFPTACSLEPKEDGRRLIATAQDSWQLRGWILSPAGTIAVREPVTLREELIRQLEAGIVHCCKLRMSRNWIA